MKVLSLDVSSKTGYALFENGHYISSGSLEKIALEDFNVNKDPDKSPKYPWNIIDAAESMAQSILALYSDHKPDVIVIENTVKGRNRHVQRYLEFLHSAILRILRPLNKPIVYIDPSAWRSLVGLKLSLDQKKNNKEVSAGKKRGKIGKKHLSVELCNKLYNLQLKLKDNDQCDSILLNLGYHIKNNLCQS
jgi:hypothetical protein